jgi:hypothetical protein
VEEIPELVEVVAELESFLGAGVLLVEDHPFELIGQLAELILAASCLDALQQLKDSVVGGV